MQFFWKYVEVSKDAMTRRYSREKYSFFRINVPSCQIIFGYFHVFSKELHVFLQLITEYSKVSSPKDLVWKFLNTAVFKIRPLLLQSQKSHFDCCYCRWCCCYCRCCYFRYFSWILNNNQLKPKLRTRLKSQCHKSLQ